MINQDICPSSSPQAHMTSPGPPPADGTATTIDPVDLDICNEEVKEYVKHHCHLQTHHRYMQLSGDRQWKQYMLI